jgi:anti-sigma regulatory factor (Ser/Thr protein kinase)
MQPLILPGTLDSLKPIRDFVTEAARAAGLDTKRTYRLRLAVDEIATNIVTHGYAGAGLEGTVSLHAKIEKDTVAIVIEDTGATFDPGQSAPQVDLDTPIEERKIGGLGIFLVSQITDKVSYERVDNLNRNTVYMNRPADSTSGKQLK